MIVRERQHSFILIEQHEHALISGLFAQLWKDAYFLQHERRKDVNFAIQQHDVSWVPLDDHPIYLLAEDRPAAFTEYPLEKKLHAYKRGVDQVSAENLYAGYLISLHYTSFFEGKKDPRALTFKHFEECRQQRIEKELQLHVQEVSEPIQFHFDLLQFCDDLSLFLCMNEWGVSKENEFSWFKEGFRQRFAPLNDDKHCANWDGENTVQLTSFPFEKEFNIDIPYKELMKNRINKEEFPMYYQQEKKQYHSVTIRCHT